MKSVIFHCAYSGCISKKQGLNSRKAYTREREVRCNAISLTSLTSLIWDPLLRHPHVLNCGCAYDGRVRSSGPKDRRTDHRPLGGAMNIERYLPLVPTSPPRVIANTGNCIRFARAREGPGGIARFRAPLPPDRRPALSCHLQYLFGTGRGSKSARSGPGEHRRPSHA